MRRRPADATGQRLLLAAALLAALLAALAVAGFWALFWQQSAGSALVQVPVLDEAWYLREAARLREAGGPGDRPLVMSPGYPVLVAATGAPAPDAHGVLPAPPRALVAVQALLWLTTGLIIAAAVLAAARRAAGPVAPRGGEDRPAAGPAALAVPVGVALTAALLFLLYRPAAIYARCVLLEIPLAALVAAAMALVAGHGPSRRQAAAAGLALGLATLLRAHVLVLLPLLLHLIWWRPARPAPSRRAARAITLALAAALALLPPALASWHNTRVLGRPAGPSLNAGINLYLGQVSTDGFFPVLPDLDLEDDPAGRDYLAARRGEPVPDAGLADRAWLAEARRLILADPVAAAGRWLETVHRHLQAVEIAQVTPLALWPQAAPVLRALAAPWSLTAVLAGAALLALWPARRPPARPASEPSAALGSLWRAAWPWLLAAALLVAVQGLFFMVSRYRLVLVPLLAVPAGLGLLGIRLLLRQRAYGRLLAVAAGAVVLAILAQPWGLRDDLARRTALQEANLARRLLVRAEQEAVPGDRRRAEDLLASATAAVPARTDLWRLRAVNLHRLGQTDAAFAVLADGAMRAADPRPLALLRVGLLRATGRLDQAEALLLAELRTTPEDPDLLHDLAVLRGERGRWLAAAEAARRLLAAAPEDPRGWLDLAVSQARRGDRQAAVQTLREGMGRVPDARGRGLLAENLRRLADAGDGTDPGRQDRSR